jgi:hypothetical protein
MRALFSAASFVSRRLLTAGGQVSPVPLDVGNHSLLLPIADFQFEKLRLSRGPQSAIGNWQSAIHKLSA